MSDTYTNYKIKDTELFEKKISRLPDRPNAPSHYGGEGLSADELKNAFDGQIEKVQEKFNDLCDALNAREGPGSAEAGRRFAELQRKSAEESRVSAEESRVSAETNRFNTFGRLMNQFEAVLHQAESKTDAINADDVVLAVIAKLPVGDEVSY